MSDEIKDGGPAFPAEITLNREVFAAAPYQFGNDDFKTPGMSLRDYFAAKSLPVAWKAFEDGYFTEDRWESINRTVAECAYQMADAMLAARSR